MCAPCKHVSLRNSTSLADFESIKRSIRDRVDFAQVVSESVKLVRKGSRLVGLCPFHSEKTPSFTVSPDQGFFKCFGCGAGGDVFSFVQQKERVSFMEAMQLLADKAGIELKFSPDAGGKKDGNGPSGRAGLMRVMEWAAGYFRSR
ncbi:MAG: CHC2 zinc finger domain-containing protein, partial [Phycisphaerae bacterium]